jgi:acetolactate synthase-1/2/3 large subunit
LPANPVLEYAFKQTDLLITIGHRLDFDLAFGFTPALNGDAKVIQVDIEPRDIGRYRPVEVGIISDARTALESLLQQTHPTDPKWSSWLSSLAAARRTWFDELEDAASRSETPMHPMAFLRGISSALPKDAIVVTSHGNIDFWADVHFQIHHPGGYLRAGQSGTLGAEIPYGLAAKLAHPDKPVVVIVGDGGFGYHAFELDTASRYNIPFIIAIGNDSSWGAIALPQEREYGRSFETSLHFRNYEQIAEILGGYGELVDSSEDVTPAVKRAIDSNLPSVLNVRIDSVESRYMRKI